MAALTADELEAALAGLPGWQVLDGKLTRIYTTASFAAALELVNRAGEAAEAANHHPDISINYNRVTFSLMTHDEGGITQKDVDLAHQIDGSAT